MDSNNRHINYLIFQVINLLQRRKEFLSYDEVKYCSKINDDDFKIVLPSLLQNARIEANENHLKFKPIYNITNQLGLEETLKNCYLDGIRQDTLKETFTFTLNNNSSESKIVGIPTKNNSNILFFNDMQIPSVSKDIHDLWHSILLPEKYYLNK